MLRLLSLFPRVLALSRASSGRRLASSVSEIDKAALARLLQQRSARPLLIDVREPDEFRAGAIPTAVNVPLGQIESVLRDAGEWRRIVGVAPPPPQAGEQVVFYCRSGRRSAMAAAVAAHLGLRAVNYLGSYLDWSSAPPITANDIPQQVEAADQAMLDADAAQNRCEFDVAIDLYGKAIELKPQWALPYRRRGILYDMVRRQSRDAERDLSKAVELDRTDADNLRARATLYGRIGRLPEALADFEAALALAPSDVNLAFDRAHILQRLGRHRDAIAAYGQALSLTTRGPGILSNRAISLMAVGEFEAAIDDLNNAIEMEPCNPRNSFNRAMAILSLLSHTNAQHAGKSLFVLTKQQREQDEALSLRAVKDLSRVIDLEPENLEALCNRGTLFGIRNEFEKAIKDYTTALTMPAITPDMAARVRFNRASAYRAIGDRAGAIQDYSAVVDHGVPYSGEKEQVCMACVHLATLEAEQGNQAHALKAIQSALAIDPSFAPALAWKASRQADK